MSDTKALNLTSLVSKKTRRAKARLLQNLGKADRTTDELFEVYQQNFNRQQSTALNLQKHVKHYLQCLKELHEASKGLNHCLLELHEKDWPKHDVYENNAYEMDHINEDLEEKIKESVLVPLEQYLSQFAEMREKIAKRGRKLVDYDSQRHTFETLQQHQQAKQNDDSKLSKSREQLEEARRVYDALNNELHDELPTLYDNRLPLIITVFQRLFSSRVSYYEDGAAIQKGYLETVEQLAKATEKGGFASSSASNESFHPVSNVSQSNKMQSHNSRAANSTQSLHTTTTTSASGPVGLQSAGANTTASNQFSTNGNMAPNADDSQNSQQQQPSSSTNPPVYLHKVRATYKYIAEDEDELSFEAGEIIQVIEYDDPQEQEEGWLMGIKETNGQKGLFPANFTKEI